MSVFLSILLCFLLHELRFCSSRKDSDLENALLLFSFHGKNRVLFWETGILHAFGKHALFDHRSLWDSGCVTCRFRRFPNVSLILQAVCCFQRINIVKISDSGIFVLVFLLLHSLF